MQIKEIKLVNFRSFKEEQTINNLSSVNIFIGPNATGKSNVVEAFRYLIKILRGQGVSPFKDMVFDRNENSEIEFSICFIFPLKDRKKIIEKLFNNNPNVKLDDVMESPFLKTLTYSITIKNYGVVGEEIVTPNIKSGEIVIIRKAEEGGTIRRESVNLEAWCNKLSEHNNIEASFTDRGKEERGWRLLSYSKLSPTEASLIDSIRGFMNKLEIFDSIRRATPRMGSGEEVSLDPQGNNLTKFMNSIQSDNPRRFIAIVDKVIEILPSLKEILAPLRQSEATVIIKEEGLETPTEIADVSVGLMQILILVVGIITKGDGSVIFIEEPELHLHATSQRRLFRLIQTEAKSKQFFLTTHSTIFTACDEQNSTYLFTKPHGASIVRRIQDSKEMKMVKEALGHRNTDLFGDECVVFIEGDTEEVAFPIIAEALGYNFVSKGIRLVNIKGSGKAKKMEEYLRYLRDTGIISYVIADGNKEVKKKLEDWQKEGIIGKGFWKIWELEFEDCFRVEMVIEAFDKWLKEEGVKFQLISEKLKIEKKEGESVAKTLRNILRDNNLIDLNKPALAEKLAYLLSDEIKKKGHKETPIEEEIRKIVELVETRRKEI